MAQAGTIVQGSLRNYRLVKLLGEGGEGAVYTTDHPDLVVKIYKKPTDVKERKIRSMLRRPLEPRADGVHLLIAWPQDIIFENNAFVGYAMPLVRDTHPIFILCRNNEKHKMDCHEIFPFYDWRYSLMVAYHLAWTVSYIHANSYVIGDMNSNNIVVHGDGTITLLDVDSFDFTDPQTGEHFPCTVGISEFLPPELQGRDVSRAKFNKHTDEFALAIHIFILLMNNTHPFTLRSLTQEELAAQNVYTLCEKKASTAQDQKMVNIVNGYCPFIRNIEGYGIPWPAPNLHMLPAKIQTAFRTTFGYDASTAMARIQSRVSADVWRVLLFEYFQRSKGPNADMVRCARNEEHFYLKSRGSCELCAAADRYQAYKDSRMNRKPRTSTPQTKVPAFAPPPASGPQPWKVEFTGWTDTKDGVPTFLPFRNISEVYVHFKVTGGPAGQSCRMKYSWTMPGTDSSQKQIIPFSFDLSVNQTGWLHTDRAGYGLHRVSIYDSNDREIATAAFTVEQPQAAPAARPAPASAPPLGVQILCLNNDGGDTSRHTDITAGEPAYVHIRITGGTPGQSGKMYYQWQIPDTAAPVNQQTHAMDVVSGQIRSLGFRDTSPGTHCLIIFDSNYQQIAHQSFTVAAVPQPGSGSCWQLGIVGITDSALEPSGFMDIHEGDYCFIHFKVLKGIPNLTSTFHFQWIAPDGSYVQVKTPQTLTLGEVSWVGHLTPKAGVHRVLMYDNSQNLLLDHCVTVGPRQKKTLFGRLKNR